VNSICLPLGPPSRYLLCVKPEAGCHTHTHTEMCYWTTRLLEREFGTPCLRSDRRARIGVSATRRFLREL